MFEGCDLTAPALPAPPVQCLRTGRRRCAWWTGLAAARRGARVGWRFTWRGSGAPSATTTGTAATPPSSAASSVSRRVWPSVPARLEYVLFNTGLRLPCRWCSPAELLPVWPGGGAGHSEQRELLGAGAVPERLPARWPLRQQLRPHRGRWRPLPR